MHAETDILQPFSFSCPSSVTAWRRCHLPQRGRLCGCAAFHKNTFLTNRAFPLGEGPGSRKRQKHKRQFRFPRPHRQGTGCIEYPGVMVVAWFIIIGTLLAWGVLCAAWAAVGWLFPRCPKGTLLWLCGTGESPEGILLRYRWLRGLGVIRGPLVLAGSSLSPKECQIWAVKCPGVEFCSLEDASTRLEVERDRLE